MNTCGDCRYYDKFHDELPAECTRYPPVPVLHQGESIPTELVWSQPQVDEYDTCGEHKPKAGSSEGKRRLIYRRADMQTVVLELPWGEGSGIVPPGHLTFDDNGVRITFYFSETQE